MSYSNPTGIRDIFISRDYRALFPQPVHLFSTRVELKTRFRQTKRWIRGGGGSLKKIVISPVLVFVIFKNWPHANARSKELEFQLFFFPQYSIPCHSIIFALPPKDR
ncbi:hypothetical protein CDAR_221041 [Caerostris darwini]|uniref:Uncharacterized protein n=1 Tax=Caerostris darwini TaxID=1538125 RepID=A0AAV4P4A0_9ARAC|nr:hypothetical protein CDAR_221041 [Caerostris darwini]